MLPKPHGMQDTTSSGSPGSVAGRGAPPGHRRPGRVALSRAVRSGRVGCLEEAGSGLHLELTLVSPPRNVVQALREAGRRSEDLAAGLGHTTTLSTRSLSAQRRQEPGQDGGVRLEAGFDSGGEPD